MRFAILTSILLLLGCQRESYAPVSSDCLSLGEQLTLPGGASLEVMEIDDQRCPPNANCVWGGYFRVVLSNSDTTLYLADRTVPEWEEISDRITYGGTSLWVDSVSVKEASWESPGTAEEYCVSLGFGNR